MTNPLSSLLNNNPSAPGLSAANAASGDVCTTLFDLLGVGAAAGVEAGGAGDFAQLLGGSAGQGGTSNACIGGDAANHAATEAAPGAGTAQPSLTPPPLHSGATALPGARSPVASLPRAIRLERLANGVVPPSAGSTLPLQITPAISVSVAGHAQVAGEHGTAVATMEIVCEFPNSAAEPATIACGAESEAGETSESLVLGKGRLGRAEQEALMAMLAPWLAQVQPPQPVAPVAPTPAATTPMLPAAIEAIGAEGEGAPMTIDLGDGRAPAMALPVGLATSAQQPNTSTATPFTDSLEASAPAAAEYPASGEMADGRSVPTRPTATPPSATLGSMLVEQVPSGTGQAELPTADRLTRPARVENSAISAAAANGASAPQQSHGLRNEKNFLSTDGQQVKQSRRNAGIGVAQKDDAMATTSNPAPTTLTALQPTWGAVAREAVAEAGETATENAARRAVAAVTAVMDANAESRLKAAPAVSLRFKVGHEDLAVRIEMRGGQVRTEFHTDSAELQAAVAQEWRSLAASPDSLLRNQEPIFVNNSNSQSSSGQGGSTLSQQQQQGQSSAHAQAREQQDHFGRVVRRVPVAMAAADTPLASLTLPSANSHRLSAVA